MGLSAKEAAEAVGISKHGIIKAINRGRISANKNVNGDWEIDPAELFRVYEPTKSVSSDNVPTIREQVNDSTQTKLAVLETKLAATEAQNKDLRDRLERLERKSEERETQLLEVVKSQTRLLEAPQKPKGGVWGWLVGNR